MTNISTVLDQLEKLLADALKCSDEAARVQYIAAANNLIHDLKDSGEIDERELLEMSREWVSAYVTKQGRSVAGMASRWVQ